MPPNPPVQDQSILLLGSEACAQGAIEAGAHLACCVFSAETAPALKYIKARAPEDLKIEETLTESTAMGLAFGNCIAGQRSFVCLTSASAHKLTEFSSQINRQYIRGGLVICILENTQFQWEDCRRIAKALNLALIEPASPWEAKKFVTEAFNISEEIKAPVLVRLTPSTTNILAEVLLESPQRERRKSGLEKKVYSGKKNTLENILLENEQLNNADLFSTKTDTFSSSQAANAIVCSGAVADLIYESLADLPDNKIKPGVIRFRVINPLNSKTIAQLAQRAEKILVLEEGSPFLEERLKLLTTAQANMQVFGTKSWHAPGNGNPTPETIALAVSNFIGNTTRTDEDNIELDNDCNGLAPTAGPGCPARTFLVSLRRAVDSIKDPHSIPIIIDMDAIPRDATDPELWAIRDESRSGPAVSVALGLAAAGIQRPLTIISNITSFFDSGLQSLIAGSLKTANLKILLLANSGICSQESGSPCTSMLPINHKRINQTMEELLTSFKELNVKKISANTPSKLEKALLKSIKSPALQLLIIDVGCHGSFKPPYSVVSTRCIGTDDCAPSCLDKIDCPALQANIETGKAFIEVSACRGCELCAQACGQKAIRKSKISKATLPQKA